MIKKVKHNAAVSSFSFVSEGNERKKELTGYMVLLGVAVIWGWGFIAGKQSLESFSALSILFYRFLIAAVLTFVIFRKRILRSDRNLIIKGAVIGLFQMAGLLLQLYGLNFTTTANQSFLCTCYPVFVPFVSWLILRKRPESKAFLAGLTAIAGLALISINGEFRLGIGDTLSIAFAIVISFQMVFISKFMKEELDPFALSFWEMVAAFLAAALICLFTGNDLIRPVISGSFTIPALLGVIYLGTFNTVAALAGQNIGQRHTKDTTASLVMSLESVFGLLFSVLYYHTELGLRFFGGALLCMTAVFISVYEKNVTEKTDRGITQQDEKE